MKHTALAPSPVFAIAADATLPVASPPPLPPATAKPEWDDRPCNQPVSPQALAEMCAARRQRNDGWTPMRITVFLTALSQGGTVADAAKLAGITTAACYSLRNHPDAAPFRAAWDAARGVRHEELIDIAMDRVRNGVERKRWWRDQIVGVDYLYSDRLLIHLLKQTDPDRVRAPRQDVPAQMSSQPMAADFVVAAAVEAGKLGWDPDHDEELEWDEETMAGVEAARAERETAAAEAAARRARIDEQLKPSLEVRLRTAERVLAARTGPDPDFDPATDWVTRTIAEATAAGLRTEASLGAEDAAWEERLENLSRALSLSTSVQEPKKSRSAARVSSGASSGRKCPPGTPKPRTSSA